MLLQLLCGLPGNSCTRSSSRPVSMNLIAKQRVGVGVCPHRQPPPACNRISSRLHTHVGLPASPQARSTLDDELQSSVNYKSTCFGMSALPIRSSTRGGDERDGAVADPSSTRSGSLRASGQSSGRRRRARGRGCVCLGCSWVGKSAGRVRVESVRQRAALLRRAAGLVPFVVACAALCDFVGRRRRGLGIGGCNRRAN